MKKLTPIIVIIIVVGLIIFFFPKSSSKGIWVDGSGVAYCDCIGFERQRLLKGSYNDLCYGMTYNCETTSLLSQ